MTKFKALLESWKQKADGPRTEAAYAVKLPVAEVLEVPAAPASGCAAAGGSDLSVVGLALGALSLIRRRRS
jgi:hypothetical protein